VNPEIGFVQNWGIRNGHVGEDDGNKTEESGLPWFTYFGHANSIYSLNRMVSMASWITKTRTR